MILGLVGIFTLIAGIYVLAQMKHSSLHPNGEQAGIEANARIGKFSTLLFVVGLGCIGFGGWDILHNELELF